MSRGQGQRRAYAVAVAIAALAAAARPAHADDTPRRSALAESIQMIVSDDVAPTSATARPRPTGFWAGLREHFFIQESATEKDKPGRLSLTNSRTEDAKGNETVERTFASTFYARLSWDASDLGLDNILPGAKAGDAQFGVAWESNTSGGRDEASSFVFMLPFTIARSGGWIAPTDEDLTMEKELPADIRTSKFSWEFAPRYETDQGFGARAFGGSAMVSFDWDRTLGVGRRSDADGSADTSGDPHSNAVTRSMSWHPSLGIEFGNLSEFADPDGLGKTRFGKDDREIDEGSFVRFVAKSSFAYQITKNVAFEAGGEYRRLESVETGDHDRWFASVGLTFKLGGDEEKGEGSDKRLRFGYAERSGSDRKPASFSLFIGRKVGELPPNFGRIEVNEISVAIQF